MSLKPGDPYVTEFVTTNATTGAATNADSLPTGTVNRNGTDDGTVTVTVTNIDTGRYKAAFTIPVTYTPGDAINISIAATVGGVAGKGIIDTIVLDKYRLSDINITAGNVMSVLANGVAHGGTPGSSTATLALSRLFVTAQTANDHAVSIKGNGSGHGLLAIGGDGGGNGFQLQGGSGGGTCGVYIMGGDAGGNGVYITARTGFNAGVSIVGSIGEPGVNILGGSSGPAARFTGGGGAPDVLLNGSGRLQGDLGGRVLGNTATAFGGNGVQVDKTGYSIGGYAPGQDPATMVSNIIIAGGKNLKDSLRYIGAMLSGKVSGVGSGTEVFSDWANTAAVTVTCDTSGNRTAVTLN